MCDPYLDEMRQVNAQKNEEEPVCIEAILNRNNSQFLLIQN